MDNRKKALIVRVGGLGDCLILTPVAKELNKRGFDVDVFFGSPTGDVFELFKGLPFIKNLRKITRVNNIDCISFDGDTGDSRNFIAVDILKKNYDEVFDYKFSVEDNHAPGSLTDGWRNSANSNYQNWVDLSLSWANIDPARMDNNDKIPSLNIPENYRDWAIASLVGEKSTRQFKVIGIQLQASSLIRTWYKADELPRQLYKLYPDDLVVMYMNNSWQVLTKNGQQKIEFPAGLNPLICSAALVREMDLFVCADSGMSHVSEAVGTPSITTYTTVPAWTRSKYYPKQIAIEATPECYPCFTLHVFCPLEMKKAQETLSDREKEIFQCAQSGGNVFELAKKLNTVPNAIMGELKSAQQRVEALSASEPACVRSITSQAILNKIKQILPKKVSIINFTENLELTEKAE